MTSKGQTAHKATVEKVILSYSQLIYLMIENAFNSE